MNKIRVTTMKKKVRENGSWTGYIAPNRVNAYHVAGGWHLGIKVKIMSENELFGGVTYYAFFGEGNEPRETRKLDEFVNGMIYYMDKELGNNVSYWED